MRACQILLCNLEEENGRGGEGGRAAKGICTAKDIQCLASCTRTFIEYLRQMLGILICILFLYESNK